MQISFILKSEIVDVLQLKDTEIKLLQQLNHGQKYGLNECSSKQFCIKRPAPATQIYITGTFMHFMTLQLISN